MSPTLTWQGKQQPETYPAISLRLSEILQVWDDASRKGHTMELAELYREQGRFDEAERVILTLDESRSWHAAAQRGVFGTMPTCMPKGLNTLFNV